MARLSVDDVTGVVVHTDLRRTGWFRCSDERLNRFHEPPCGASAATPATSRPTARTGSAPAGRATGSCSSRPPRSSTTSPGSRRSGCATSPPSSGPTGCVLDYVPDPRRREPPMGDPTWSDLLGVRRLGRRHASSCRGSCGAPTATRRAGGVLAGDGPLGRLRRRAAARTSATRAGPRARPSRRRTRSTSGTAASTGASGASPARRSEPFSGDATRATSPPPTSTHRAALAARTAACSATTTRRRGSRSSPNGALDAWRTEYIADDGSLRPDTQANHVRALAFGLVPDELRAQDRGSGSWS